MASRSWCIEEDWCVKELTLAGLTTTEIGALLERHWRTVKARQGRLGLRDRLTPMYLWTAAEDELVSELCRLMTDAELGRLIGRSRQAVATRRAAFLGLANEGPVVWTPDELGVLKVAFPLMPVDDVAAILPTRTKKAVVGMAHRLGLRRRHLANLPGGHVPLPPELREVIRLAKSLRKGIADEERRRSARAAV